MKYYNNENGKMNHKLNFHKMYYISFCEKFKKKSSTIKDTSHTYLFFLYSNFIKINLMNYF